MKFKIAVLLLVIFLSNNSILKSEQKYKFDQSIYLLVGYPAGPNAEDFFNVYKKYVGGSKDEFIISPIIGVGTKFTILNNIKIGLLGYFYQCTFRDSYGQKIFPTNESPERWVSEDLIIKNYPLFFTTEYNPYIKSQFHTYVGIGLGCNFGKINWNEAVSSPEPADKRIGGPLVHESTYSFISRFYLGMELGFDKRTRKYLLGGLIFEAAYVYDSRRIDMFEKLYPQFYVAHEELKDKYPIIPGIFELSMAVSLVFR
ncbi:MAG: hypothetical protein WCR42_07410 [bacterium]